MLRYVHLDTHERAARREAAIKRVVQQEKDSFHRFINKDELQSKMAQQRLLTPREKEIFMSHGGQDVDIEFLISTLEKKSNDAFTRFYEALKSETRHLGHQDLVQLIDQVL